MEEEKKSVKQENNKLISILMPTFNVAPFIEEAVRSILTQTYRNVELIIVDDCSSDKTYEILQRLAEEDERIVLERNSTNNQICKTLNRAWTLAKGEFIARMDGDDISAPERLEVLKSFLDEHDDIDLVGSQVISINESGGFISKKQYLRTPEYIKRGNRYGPAVVHIWMARRRVYEVLNGYRDIPYAEDYDFLLRGEKNGFKYANVEEYLYKVRIRKGNTGSTNGLEQRKTKEFILKINSSRFDEGEDIEKQHMNAILSTIQEQKRFEKAHAHLDVAVQSRSHPLKLLYHTLLGMFESKYVFSYMVDAVKMRWLLHEENRILPRVK